MTSNAEAITPMVAFMGLIINRHILLILPHSRHKCLAQLPPSRRSAIVRLAGILRLANAFDLSHERKVRRLHVGRHDGMLIVRGEGYAELGPSAERVAAARYLLELNCQMPV